MRIKPTIVAGSITLLALACWVALPLLSSAQVKKTPQNAPQQAEQPKKPAEGTTAKIVDAAEIGSVLGKDVYSASGENIGRIVDVLVDRSGKVKAAVVDFGGFLGVGSRKIAVEWSSLHFGSKGSTSLVTVDLDREQLRVAPEVKQGEPVVIVSGERPPRT